jgi:hypothetical protein
MPLPIPAPTPREVIKRAIERGANPNALRHLFEHHRHPDFVNRVRFPERFAVAVEALVLESQLPNAQNARERSSAFNPLDLIKSAESRGADPEALRQVLARYQDHDFPERVRQPLRFLAAVQAIVTQAEIAKSRGTDGVG